MHFARNITEVSCTSQCIILGTHMMSRCLNVDDVHFHHWIKVMFASLFFVKLLFSHSIY